MMNLMKKKMMNNIFIYYNFKYFYYELYIKIKE